MDKIQTIKLLLISKYFSYLRKLNMGYPLSGYDQLIDTMIKINIIQHPSTSEEEKATLTLFLTDMWGV